MLRAIDRDEGGNDSTVYFSIPPESSAALNFSVRDSGGRHSIFPSLCSSLNSCLSAPPLADRLFLPPTFLRPFFSAFLFPSSSFLLFSLSRSSQNHSLSESPSLFLSLPLSPIHLPCLVAPLFCFVILPSFVSSLLLYPLHPSSSPRPCKLSISTEKLLKKSKLLRLISVN